MLPCRLFKIHDYKFIIETEKYYIKKCIKCNTYKVNYKIYNINSRFKKEELPLNITNILKEEC